MLFGKEYFTKRNENHDRDGFVFSEVARTHSPPDTLLDGWLSQRPPPVAHKPQCNHTACTVV